MSILSKEKINVSRSCIGGGYNRGMILLTGASASGKTEVAKMLRKNFGIVKAVTHTTRAPRAGETNGIDYHFVSDRDFLAGFDRGEFVEKTFYNGHYYGCSKKEVAENKCIVVDPHGLRSFLALKDPSVVTFYLEASEATREKRMIHRGDKKEDIEKRLLNDRVDFAPSAIAPTDFHIVTDDKTLEQIAQDVYSKYQSTLKARKLGAVIVPK